MTCELPSRQLEQDTLAASAYSWYGYRATSDFGGVWQLGCIPEVRLTMWLRQPLLRPSRSPVSRYSVHQTDTNQPFFSPSTNLLSRERGALPACQVRCGAALFPLALGSAADHQDIWPRRFQRDEMHPLVNEADTTTMSATIHVRCREVLRFLEVFLCSEAQVLGSGRQLTMLPTHHLAQDRIPTMARSPASFAPAQCSLLQESISVDKRLNMLTLSHSIQPI